MANASAKRIGVLGYLLFIRHILQAEASQNEIAIRNLFYGQVGANVLALVLRLFFSKTSKTAIVFYVLSLGAGQFLYRQLVKMGTPRRDATGTLVSSGDDLNQPGMTEWFFDVLYVSWFAQVGSSVLGEWFWWIYAAIPGFVVFKLWGSFISPMLLGRSSSAAEAEDAAPESNLSKRQEKLKKRNERGDPRVKTQTRR
ncbi:DUF788-domain-containing protein [Auriscalpium vulgare]|uniref:DUF788-domain-containing protein n=1 Tax=Auriscalpium vulgare TaxID=40419 RepID=A0ACB8R9Z5_9AGAM|nr:DUF788-domain-containing protein [Auriscalpium vulgare]